MQRDLTTHHHSPLHQAVQDPLQICGLRLTSAPKTHLKNNIKLWVTNIIRLVAFLIDLSIAKWFDLVVLGSRAFRVFSDGHEGIVWIQKYLATHLVDFPFKIF